MACKAGFGDRAGYRWRGAVRAEIAAIIRKVINREIGGTAPTLLSPLRRPS
jgi:hypothetical protein